jgi:hypothetical protein
MAAISRALSAPGELPPAAREAASRAVLRQWNRTPKDPHGGVAYAFATELFDTREVSDETFGAALQELGERRLVDLLVLLGHTNLHCARLALAGMSCAL